MSFALESPRWMWLLLLMIPLALMGWSWFSAMSASRRISAILLRLGLLALLAAMLAGISSIRTSGKLAVVAVVDVSGSIKAFANTPATATSAAQTAQQRVRTYLKAVAAARGREDLLGIIVFDGSTTAIAAPQPGRLVVNRAADQPSDEPTDLLDRTWEVVTPAPGSTDIASAIRLAAAMLPPDAVGRVILFSDGNQTQGDALAAAAAASSALGPRSVPIDVVPLRYAITHEVIVDSIDAPARASAAAVIDARVNIRSTHAATGTLRLLVNGQEAPFASPQASRTRRITLAPGPNTILVSLPLDSGRVHRLEAIFEPDAAAGSATVAADTITENNRAESFTLTPGTGDILIVGPEGSAKRPLAATLRAAGLTVQESSPEGMPADLLKLQAFDAVILENAPADAIPPAALEALQRYVTETGGGLCMIGGTNSFGAGSWRTTPIEPILPVKLDLPDQLVVPAAAVIIIMDTSGSMGWSVMGSSRTQQDIANEGAAIAVRTTLQRDDLVGVIEFNSNFSVIVPLHKNTDAEATANKLLSLSPGGGTNLPPALREAYSQLRTARAAIKHCIVLSDGMSNGKSQLPGIVQQMKSDGITVSTIAVGDKADLSGMEDMATIGGGKYYRVTDPNTLPQIFIHAVKVVRTPMIREEPFRPAVNTASGSSIIAGLPTDVPNLGGLVLTQPRPEIENGQPAGVTYAMLTPKGEPVLAIWQAGLGQVAAFTSDASVWAADWQTWPGYRQMWVQLVRSIARPDASRAGELAVRRAGDELVTTLDLADANGKPRDGAEIGGFVYAPDGSRIPMRMLQIGPGQYEGRVPLPEVGNSIITLTPKDAATRLPPIVGSYVQPPGAEYRTLSSNEALLKQIAGATGGRVLDIATPEEADLFNRKGIVPREARLPLWPVLIIWAIGVMLADVATRKVAWDRLISRKFGASLLKDAAAATADRTSQASETLKGLRQAEAVPAESGKKALGTDDAKRLVQEARERRMAQRQGPSAPAAMSPKSATTERQAAPTPSSPTTTPVTPPPANDASNPLPASGPESPFQAAKRRAKERLDGQ